MFEIEKNFKIPLNLSQEVLHLSLIWVNAGDFVLGNHHEEHFIETGKDAMMDELLLSVREINTRISKGFWLSQFLITQAQWEALGNLPSNHRDTWAQNNENPFWMKPNYPVCGVSWLEAMLFCRVLNIRYKDKLPEGYHFSLPTELQWEYTSKTGVEKDEYTLSFDEFLKMYNILEVKEVGKRKPNSWGFYDMLGNIREMCYDIAAYYAIPNSIDDCSYPIIENKIIDWVGNKEPEDFIAAARTIEERVVRGGYVSTHREMRLHYADMIPLVGFRVCLRPIIDWEYCDLNDPWLLEEGINILG